MNTEEELEGIIKELKRIKKNIKNKIWRLDNPEKVKESNKKWVNNNIEKAKEISKKGGKKWRDNNKEKVRENGKKWREEKGKEYMQEYYQNNKEKLIEDNKIYYDNHKAERKIYNNTPNGYKINKIGQWKFQGLIAENYDVIYERYLNTTHCDKCFCVLTFREKITKTTRCMDHSHKTGLFRNILCISCNSKRRENNF